MCKCKFAFFIGVIFLILAYVLLFVRSYFGDDFFVSKQGYFPTASHFLYPEKKEFKFAIISDTESNNLALQKIVDEIVSSKENYDFVIHLGDLLGDYTESHFYWMAKDLYTSLNGKPFFTVPGNHDVFLENSIDKEQYIEVFGPAYYWFGYGNVLFIGYDSSEIKISDKQIEWLSETLTKIRPLFKYCVIYSHVPPINPPDKSVYRLDNDSIKKLENVLKNHKVDLLVFGHVHYFSEEKFAGIPVYTLPPSGQRPRPEKSGYGYVGISVGKNGIDNIKPYYVDIGKTSRKNKIAIFLIDNLLTTRACHTSVYLLIIGFLLILFHKKFVK